MKTLIRQVKVLRDTDKTQMSEDGSSVVKLASGLAFAEFSEPLVALYAVRYLNNMYLSGQRGLVVDFALEDARKLHIRQTKIEKFQKQAQEKRDQAKKETRLLKRQKLRDEEQLNESNK